MAHYACLAASALLLLPAAASAHRLDEYLQATTIGLSRDHIALHLRLTPGVDVAEGIIRQIDINSDGILSSAEQHAYITRMTRNLSASLNGKPLFLTLESATFPPPTAIRGGTGVLDLRFTIQAPLQNGPNRLTYTNRGAGPETVWLVNCLLPQDPDLHVLQQRRSRDQSDYQLDFTLTPRKTAN
ncbi:hypothetical protein [Gluconobacter morbifer]|uniref:EF-hand domain-containing protein n=1 Tax=Gluconobacter morbifer G707 TaxID=1088869 RepID=G6XEU3_9PROT|nr:hypothetical protein [Gluconobacter morbifer]EHH68701.1 hypothetical protein GMO_00080 [Gluconobacter morbifer G707]